jgi:uncharacterized protein (DUF4415 family)
MTAKTKKAKRRKVQVRPGKVIELRASVEDDQLFLAEEGRPRGEEPSTQAEDLVTHRYRSMDWFKSRGPGYQTRITGS